MTHTHQSGSIQLCFTSHPARHCPDHPLRKWQRPGWGVGGRGPQRLCRLSSVFVISEGEVMHAGQSRGARRGLYQIGVWVHKSKSMLEHSKLLSLRVWEWAATRGRFTVLIRGYTDMDYFAHTSYFRDILLQNWPEEDLNSNHIKIPDGDISLTSHPNQDMYLL